jgi:hypothetical protein
LIALIKTEDLAKKILTAMHLPSDARACPPTPAPRGFAAPVVSYAPHAHRARPQATPAAAMTGSTDQCGPGRNAMG